MAYICVLHPSKECDGCGECAGEMREECQKCGMPIYDDEYSDEDYDTLCLDCLEELHKKRR